MTGKSNKIQKGVVGGWLLHHDQKLLNAKTVEFENIVLAGRASRLLSAISREGEWTVPDERVAELAGSLGIRKVEIPGLLLELQNQGLVQSGSGGISVLGVSQAKLLDHAADIFESHDPSGLESAAIDLAERGSSSPLRRSDVGEELSDIHKLSKTELDDLFTQSEHIGFVDYEGSGTDRLYFNGSLFKREKAEKAKRIFEGLTPDEQQKLLDVDGQLGRMGCIPAAQIKSTLGDILWSKMHQIGYFEVSVVANEKGQTEFVTKPEALTKFIPTGLADMLDDAKALASSLTYGIVKSSNARGRIKDPSVLMDVFVNRGYVEGWADALRQDYQVLERRGVVQVTSSPRGHRLSLLKQEVGEMAKQLVLKGDASQAAAETIIGSNAAQFFGPERSRTAERKKDIPEARSGASRALNILRKST